MPTCSANDDILKTGQLLMNTPCQEVSDSPPASASVGSFQRPHPLLFPFIQPLHLCQLNYMWMDGIKIVMCNM